MLEMRRGDRVTMAETVADDDVEIRGTMTACGGVFRLGGEGVCLLRVCI